MDPKLLIHRYLIGEVSEAEANELNDRLVHDAELRREFVIAAAMDTGLRDVAFEQAVDDAIKPATGSSIEPAGSAATQTSRTNAFAMILFAIAASILAVVLYSPAWLVPTTDDAAAVATLLSTENAAWESSLPTTPGSDLTPGVMKLVAGIATVRFRSGAEVMIEAPANLVLISPMRGKLLDGAAVVSVPKPAIGFVLETPDGYVVDHGTEFAVKVSGEGKPSDFEVIKGEISVHLVSTGENARLTDRQSASISQQRLTTFDGQLAERSLEQSPQVLRVGTEGRTTSVIRNNKRKKRHHPELLMVKRGAAGPWDQRAMCSFDVSDIEFDAVKSARLRLNLVPSGIGFASRLPKINRFAVYGLTNDAKSDWVIESRWEDAPGPEDGVLLGTFEIPRSVQRGSFGIENETLLEFLKSRSDQPVTLIIDRETGQIDGEGPGLVHAFASDSHPEASGPILEFSL
ncbi:FecR protein domain protein [Rhodopirellula maiorica SM1]|uniref:FecR protein domain protein n=1 Tax=Rhodopirellula maiorica SM1 TaxID=1265738 RepID=M5RI15_9BACT|nr:FecR protein [Rhodopirellula maiorica]EMI18953.1 FecR protein domain protein [Rhodopirellula maiorica SM1]